MPFTAAEIADAGKVGLDHYLKNTPIDQIQTDRPWLRKLMGMKREFPGATLYITEQLRFTYGSNFQWYYGSQVVTYNRRQTIEQAQFAWRGCHDGFFLDEDRLAQNGITLTDNTSGVTNSGAEAQQLTNLIREDTEALRLGFEERFDLELHLDGTQHPEALPGLDNLISLTPAVGTVGNINRATSAWWRNQALTGLTQANLIDNWEIIHRNQSRNGGQPDFYVAGGTFIDTYRRALMASGTVQLSTANQTLDGSIGDGKTPGNGLFWKGKPIIWDPVFDDVDTLLGALAVPWRNRMYSVNTRHMRLRPMMGHNVISRKPPRTFDQYVYYWALTWKGALTINRGNCHAVLGVV